MDMSTTPTNATSPPAAHKHARVLACVLCQHRKIKCDRNTPCSNCLKAGVSCTPSTPAPARKRRRPNQDLQERLARCEDLLKQYANGTVPVGHGLPGQSPLTPFTNGGIHHDMMASPPGSVDSHMTRKPACMVVNEDGNVRFLDSYLWATVFDELQKMRDIVETEDPEDNSVLGSDDMTPDNQSDLLLSGGAYATNLEALQPDPVHIFKLWQLYLDRVNPLTKIIHAPTVQPFVIEAASNMSGLPLNHQALLFSIFTMAAISLDDVEAIQVLGMARETAITRFLAGTKTALIKFNFMKHYNMAALQALVLYLNSLEGRIDRHAAWLVSGTIVRIAQKMGYHRDGEMFELTPFETEMRRRIWWQVVMQDSKCAMMSGLNQSLLPNNWDTRAPLNVNDADLFPGSNEPVQPREGPTEMAFCVMIHEIYRFKIDSENASDAPAFEAAVLGQLLEGDDDPNESHHSTFDKFRAHARDLERKLLDLERRIVDVKAGNVHIAALTVRPMLTHKLTEMLVPMDQQPEWGIEIFGAKDNFFKVLIMTHEHKIEAHQRMATAGFEWFMRLHFQIELFSVFTGMLCERTTGNLADRAWIVIEKIYVYHPELLDMSDKQNVVQAQFALKGWKAREAAFAQAGQNLETTKLIFQLRELLPSHDSRSAGQQSVTPPSVPQPPQAIGGFDQFLGGYLDVSTMNWDVLGDVAPNNGEQMQNSIFNGYGLNNMSLGGQRGP